MQYCAWSKDQKPDYRFIVHDPNQMGYMLFNNEEEALETANAWACRTDGVIAMLERVMDSRGEWRTKMYARFYSSDGLDDGEGIWERDGSERIGVHYIWYTESGEWLNPPDDYELPPEAQEWAREMGLL